MISPTSPLCTRRVKVASISSRVVSGGEKIRQAQIERKCRGQARRRRGRKRRQRKESEKGKGSRGEGAPHALTKKTGQERPVVDLAEDHALAPTTRKLVPLASFCPTPANRNPHTVSSSPITPMTLEPSLPPAAALEPPASAIKSEENGEPKKLPAECEEGLLYTQPSPSSPGKSKALKTI